MAAVTPLAGLDDPRLDDYRHIADPAALLARRLFVAEGRLVVARLAQQRQHAVQSVLLSDAAAAAMAPALASLEPDVPVYVVPQAVMNAVVGFNIHRGCLALAARPAVLPGIETLALPAIDRLVVAEGVNNPDNIGGLFRNAAALGAAAIVLGPGCGDPLYRKAIRTSMAASLHLPWALAAAWPGALATMRDAGLTVVACTPAADAPSVFDTPLPRRAAVLVGAEGDGLTAAALAEADLRVRIPMSGGMDSLNVATAAAVVLGALSAAGARR